MDALPLIIVCIVAILEAVLSGSWNRAYFDFGLPLLRLQIAVPAMAGIPSAKELERYVATSDGSPLVFCRVSEHRIFFREIVWSIGERLSYAPVMRGVLTFDPIGAKVRLEGIANWSPIFLLVLAAIHPVIYSHPILRWTGPVILLFFAATYVRQLRLYRDVARFASSRWSGTSLEGRGSGS